MINETQLKKSLCSLPTRRFGEFVEIVTGKLNNLQKSKDTSYDRELKNKKIEIKGSRVFNNKNENLTEKNILEVLSKDNTSTLVKDEDKKENIWNCNIQQIKVDYFDELHYSLFFEDRIYFFQITGDKIKSDKAIKYSNKQHRGNEGEGQFHIDSKNIDYHLLNYFYKSMNYKELGELLENKNVQIIDIRPEIASLPI